MITGVFNRISILFCVAAMSSLLSCVSQEERSQAPKSAEAPRIDQVIPASTAAGAGFMVQPGGQSGISIVGAGFQHGSKIRFNSQALDTTFGSGTRLTALVDVNLYQQPAVFQVTVENPDGKASNAMPFLVFASAGRVPQITRLVPDTVTEGGTFNVQPNGVSGLEVQGANFVPGATIEFDRQALITTFGSLGELTALVPAERLRRAKVVTVYVKNPDGKTSNRTSFTIQKHAAARAAPY